MVQAEPWREPDKVMIDRLKSIGIEKGKPFNPDAKMTAELLDAIAEAHAWLNAWFEVSFPPYADGAQWALPALPELMKAAPTLYETAGSYSIDQRAVTHYWAFTTVIRTLREHEATSYIPRWSGRVGNGNIGSRH
jgi:hypothetical protein